MEKGEFVGLKVTYSAPKQEKKKNVGGEKEKKGGGKRLLPLP